MFSSLPDVTLNSHAAASLPPLLSSQLPLVIEAYSGAIKELSAASHKEQELAAQTMHEQGDIMMHSGNTKYVLVLAYIVALLHACMRFSI